MKTILVTGGAGFIGSAVVRRLVGEGYRVINLDNLTNEKYLQSVRYGQSNYGSPRNVTASVSWKF